MAPFGDAGQLGLASSLAAALVIGGAFGWGLERGGMGSARKLAAQFYGTDFAVLRFMFSAIVTAMLGLFWLARAGLLDLSRVYVPPTYVVPQLVGGTVFGVGFVTAGLCPGTSCVAAATGRRDGLAVMGGMLAGVLVFHEAFPALREFYERTAAGPLTLPVFLGVPYGAVVVGVVVLAVGAFLVAARVERARGAVALPESSAHRAGWSGQLTPRRLAMGALVLGVLAPVAGSADRPRAAVVDVDQLAREVEQERDHVSALTLAAWIHDRKPGLRIFDVRTPAEYEAYHIPGAERVSLTELRATPIDRQATVVLYSDGGAHAAQGWFFLRALGVRRVYFLSGGLDEWIGDVLHPTLPADATPEARSAFARTEALVRYFGGVPRAEDDSAPLAAPGPVPAVPAPAGPAERATRARTAANPWRRSC